MQTRRYPPGGGQLLDKGPANKLQAFPVKEVVVVVVLGEIAVVAAAAQVYSLPPLHLFFYYFTSLGYRGARKCSTCMRMARALFCCSQPDETRNVLSLENPKHVTFPWGGSYHSTTIVVVYAHRQELNCS